MSFPREVFVVAAARSAIGTFGGSLKDVPLADLATLIVRHALERSGAPATSVGHLAMGTVVTTETPSDKRAYWLTRPVHERLAALEMLRQIFYAYDPDTTRFQRVLEVTHCP